jgi:cyclophilin family peptidyl-prolyl cis-trans isomerase
MLTRLLPLAFAFPLLAGQGAAPQPAAPKPRVQFTTSLGAFTLELEPEAAPKTVANFLQYVKAGHYAGTTFHRVIPTFMIQGGGHLKDLREKPASARVENEADVALAKGLRNVRGTVAMARTNDPHSAGAQFFVNTVDNAFLDHRSKDPRGWGYCVFGRVVEGMETVDKIKDVQTGTGANGMQNVPVTPVLITGAKVLGAPAKAMAKPKARPSAGGKPAAKAPAKQ